MKSSLEAKQFNYLMHVAKPSSHVLGNLLQTKILEKLYKLSGLASPEKTYRTLKVSYYKGCDICLFL